MMDKQLYEQQRQWIIAEEKRLYAAEPEVKMWINRKRMIFRFLAGFWMTHAILTVICIVQTPVEGMSIGTEVARHLFQIFWLYVCINPKGTWRLSLILFWYGMTNFVLVVMNYSDNLQGYVGELMKMMPLHGVVFILELMVPYVLFGVAGYLTLPKKHRKLSDRANEINKCISDWVRGLQMGNKEEK